MQTKPHHVSGFFATYHDAEVAMEKLLHRGLAADQMKIYANDSPPAGEAPASDSQAVLKDVVVDGAVGTAVGTGLGALAQVALVAGNVSLFIASPLLAPLAMMGWGAGIGAVVGAAVGATAVDKIGSEGKEGWLSNLVADAIASGQFVLVVRAEDEQQMVAAREVIQAAVGDYKDDPAV
jgi:hypothetical protein